jgi:CRISPR-associated exonuclease Cas4
LRQAALIHLERLWAENRQTAEGRVLHLSAHEAGGRRLRGVRRVSALPIVSRRLGIAGVADLVEFHAGPGTRHLIRLSSSGGKGRRIVPTRSNSAAKPYAWRR